jgi:oligopeptide/dipeptide ABC transporter ATP-binding protein
MTQVNTPLLSIRNLSVSFETGRGRVNAVNGVNLTVFEGQTLAVVGESGCGKSVTALSVLGLVPRPPAVYNSGQAMFEGQDLLKLSNKELRKVRGNKIAMIFQEPMTSLNPVFTIGEQIMEAVLLHQDVTGEQAVGIAVKALSDVGIADPENRIKEYPHQLSGGMRQRVMIAMALACNPRLLLADEPTTALDVTIQAQILALLRKLQHERKMSVLLITHDLGVVAENADAVAVMYAGRVVEYGSVMSVFQKPLHPYTRGLFSSMPVLGKVVKRLETIPGNVPNPRDFASGCPFHPRCKDYNNDPACAKEEPRLLEIDPGHWAACWHTPGYSQGKLSLPVIDYKRPAPVNA